MQSWLNSVLQVDGMDAFAVKQAILSAKEHALENVKFFFELFLLILDPCFPSQGPIILEMDTYRYHGHSMSDPGSTYRHRNDIQQMRKSRDCIERFKSFLVEVCLNLVVLSFLQVMFLCIFGIFKEVCKARGGTEAG